MRDGSWSAGGEPETVDGRPVRTGVRIGVIADTHWGLRPEYLQTVLDEFVDTMNEEVRPRFCLHLGDVAHGVNLDASPNDVVPESTMRRRLSECREYLEESGGSEGSGLEMPIYYVLGNHEYKGAGTWNMDTIYDALGLASLSDTWRCIDVGDWRVLLLNTFYATEDIDGGQDARIPDADDRADELGWVRERILGADGNVVAVSHQSLTDPTDYVVSKYGINLIDHHPGHGPAVAKLLSERGRSLSVHGHAHHSLNATGVRMNPFGTPQLFVDFASKAGEFGTLTLSPDGWRFTPRNTDHGTLASGQALVERERDMRRLRAQQREYDLDFENLTRFNTADTTAAASVEATGNGLHLRTGTTPGETAAATRELRTSREAGDGPRSSSTLQERRFRVVLVADELGGGERGTIVTGNPHDAFFGFEIEDGVLYGVASDGSADTRTLLLDGFDATNDARVLGAYYDSFNLSREDAVRFYEDGRPRGHVTETLPRGLDGTDSLHCSLSNPGVAANRALWIDNAWIKQPRVLRGRAGG